MAFNSQLWRRAFRRVLSPDDMALNLSQMTAAPAPAPAPDIISEYTASVERSRSAALSAAQAEELYVATALLLSRQSVLERNHNAERRAVAETNLSARKALLAMFLSATASNAQEDDAHGKAFHEASVAMAQQQLANITHAQGQLVERKKTIEEASLVVRGIMDVLMVAAADAKEHASAAAQKLEEVAAFVRENGADGESLPRC